MKNKRTIYEWLTTNFTVVVRNDDDFSMRRSFRVNYAKVFVFTVVLLLVTSFLSVSFFKWIDSYYSDEMRKDKAIRQKVARLSMAVDSLETEVARKDSFILSFKNMLTGANDPLETQKLKTRTENTVVLAKHKDQLQDAEVKLREEFENTSIEENFNKNIGKEIATVKKSSLSDIYFFPPISGLVSNHFDARTKHYGIDILAKENEPIKSVSDGSVIYSGWSYDTGYMLVVQHDEDLISVYKHNASLLKKVGEVVKSGEVVAIIGNSGELTTGPHLHFELWYKGHPLNPLDYIVF